MCSCYVATGRALLMVKDPVLVSLTESDFQRTHGMGDSREKEPGALCLKISLYLYLSERK